MSYKNEGATKDFTEFLNPFIVATTNTIYEEYHVIKNIERCADELAIFLIDTFNSLTVVQRVNPTYFKTDWFIKSTTIPNMPLDANLLTKEKTNHQITISFQNSKTSDMQNISRTILYSEQEIEKLRKAVFKEELKEDDPVILVSLWFMRFVITRDEAWNDKQIVLRALVAHELRHVIEQYILEFQNTLTSKKNTLNTDFKANNIFSLDKNSKFYEELADLMYNLSVEEQRGRIQGTYNFCQMIMGDRNYYTQLTLSTNKTRTLALYNNCQDKIEDNFRLYIVSLLRLNSFCYIHNLRKFRNEVNSLTIKVKETNRKYILIIGYFFLKHKYLTNTDRDIRNYFSKDNVTRILSTNNFSGIDDYYDYIFRAIERNYMRYENIIYNIVGQNIEKIIKRKSKEDNIVVQYQNMAASNNNRLKQWEISSINEAREYYLLSFERWLKGKLF